MKTTAKGSLLIVDGDPNTRRVAEVGLRHAGYRVTVAGSPEQALWFLERASPDAVLTAIAFDGEALGWDLVRILRARPDGARVAVLVLMIDPAMRADETADLADDLLPWPAGVRELELRVQQALVRRRVGLFLAGSGARRLTGDLRELSPIDLLTLIERSHATGTLEIEAPRGPATLWFEGGQVIDAHFGRFTGEEAIFQLLVADGGEFEWTLAPIAHAAVIEATMAETIAENLRRLDEWTRLCDELPDLDTALRVEPQRLGVPGPTLPAEQVALVERCNGRRSIREVVEDGDIDPLLALEVLRNLLQAGVLAPVGRPEGGAIGLGGLVDVGELPPLPAFPEPFPGTSEASGLDTPLVSGIPEDPGELLDFADLDAPAAPAAAANDGAAGVATPAAASDEAATSPSASPAPTRPAADAVTAETGAAPPRSAAAYVFRPPQGGRPEQASPEPVRRHDSVRIQLVDGRIEPPRGIKQAEATGELVLEGPDAERATPRIERRRQSILFHRVRPPSPPTPGETVRSSRRDYMSPSGLIAAGELVIEDASASTAGGERAGGEAGPGERSGRWAEEGPKQLLLPESVDDLGRLSAMAAQFARSPENPPPGGEIPEAAAQEAPRPLLRPPEPVEETLFPNELRRRGWVLAVLLGVVLLALVYSYVRADEATEATDAPKTAPPKAAPAGDRRGDAAREPLEDPPRAIAPPPAEGAPSVAAPAPQPEAPPAPPSPTEAERERAAALFTQAKYLYRRGELARASRAVDRALAQDPRHALALVLRANVSLEQGKLNQALDAARRAAEADPALPDAFLTLGVVAQEKRAWAEALAAYERYLELAPDARYAQSVRRQVRRLRRKLP